MNNACTYLQTKGCINMAVSTVHNFYFCIDKLLIDFFFTIWRDNLSINICLVHTRFVCKWTQKREKIFFNFMDVLFMSTERMGLNSSKWYQSKIDDFLTASFISPVVVSIRYNVIVSRNKRFEDCLIATTSTIWWSTCTHQLTAWLNSIDIDYLLCPLQSPW